MVWTLVLVEDETFVHVNRCVSGQAHRDQVHESPALRHQDES